MLVKGRRGRQTLSSVGIGAVYWAGERVSNLARVYAELTHRPSIPLNSLSDYQNDGLANVLIAEPDAITCAMLDRVYDDQSSRIVPGLIPVAANAECHSRLVAKSALLSTKRPRDISWIDIYPAEAFSIAPSEDHIMAGKLAPTDQVRRLLSTSTEVLTLVSHSDGVDAKLGRGLTLCPLLSRRRQRGLRSPYCEATGYCHRHNVSVDEVLDSDKLFAASEINCELLVFAVCHGVLPRDADVDPRLGILPALLQNQKISAIATTWGITQFEPADLEPLWLGLSNNLPLGMAIADFNRSPRSTRSGLRLCLFGDPLLRLTVPKRKDGLKARKTSAKEDFSPIRFLDAYLMSALAECRGDATKLASAALRDLNWYDFASLTDMSRDAIRGSVASLQLSVLEFLKYRGTVICHDWLPLTSHSASVSSVVCANCRSAARRKIYKFRDPAITARELVFCSRCGIIRDAELGSNKQLQLTPDRSIRLLGELPRGEWTGMLRLGCAHDSESVTMPWPRSDNGVAASAAPMPDALPPGPLKIGLALLQKASLTVLSIPREYPIDNGR